MSIESLESSEASCPFECTIGDTETISTVWNGREVSVLEEENENQANVVKEKYLSQTQLPLQKNMRHQVVLRGFAQPASKSWNFESFPIPPYQTNFSSYP